MGQVKRNPRCRQRKWAKYFYNLIKHWFSFQHFYGHFYGSTNVAVCHRKWSSMRFVLLSMAVSVRSALGFVLWPAGCWSAANWVALRIHIHACIYAVSAILGHWQKRKTYFVQLAIVGLSFWSCQQSRRLTHCQCASFSILLHIKAIRIEPTHTLSSRSEELFGVLLFWFSSHS